MTTRATPGRFFALHDALIESYVNGQIDPRSMPHAQRAQLREALMRSPVYSDPKHPRHAQLSADVRALFEADPGAELKDAGLGTVAGPAVDPQQQQGDSLFRS